MDQQAIPRKLIETAFCEMPVSVRTRLAMANAFWKMRLRPGPVAPARVEACLEALRTLYAREIERS